MQKRIFISFICLLVCMVGIAQQLPPEIDKSPMDMSYSPNSYPIMKFQGKATGTPNARVIYSRPQKKGREIFGGEVKYNDVWRLGANENTEIEFYKDAVFGGKKITKGRYSMFCIPTEENWTIILNKDTDNWGNFNYDSKKDVLRVTAPVQKIETVENFTIYFDQFNNLTVMWDDVRVSLPVLFTGEKTIIPAKGKGK